MEVLKGIPVSPGVAIGHVFVLDDVHHRIHRRSIPADAADKEIARLGDAIELSLKDLQALRERAANDLGHEAAQVFAFHQGMLRDKQLTEPMIARIRNELVTAEYAAQEQFRILASMFAGMGDTAFQTKVDDVWDLSHRLLRHLIGEHRSNLAQLDHQAVVVASDLTPSQAAAFPREHVLAFATDMGGPTSHTAIFARALGIPAVVGAGRLCDEVEEGDQIIIDGDSGLVLINPTEDTLEEYERFIEKAQSLKVSLAPLAQQPSETRDGVRIKLVGNVEFGDEANSVLEHGGDGIGLFRTEFLWLTSDHEPSEEEQFDEYRKTVDTMSGKPVVLRTFDLGADKYTQERAMVPERNPFLGCRSIRYCLQNLAMFKRQLRAILRVSALGPVKVMFPLVTNTLELRQAKMILFDVMEDLDEVDIPFDRSIEVGMMVEVPSAAVMAHVFAREVDFFSIGTNDLIQYTLAVDRTNERVANLYTGAHPAVIRLIKDVVRASRRHRVDVSCCGEMAGDPLYTMLLIGLGLRTLSVTPSRIPYLKRVVRNVDIPECERLARTVGSFDSERQVTAFLREQAKKIMPESFDGRSVEDRPL